MAKVTIKSYQKFAKKKWKPGMDLITILLGLGGETGEVLDCFKKARRDEDFVNKEHAIEEIGDVFWYLFNLCSILDLDVEQVLEANVKKLNERYKDYEKHSK